MLKQTRPILAVLVLCLLLCACGAPAVETTATTTEATLSPAHQQLLGSWQTTIDCSATCNGLMIKQMGQELAGYFDFTGVCMDAILTLHKDGTFTMTIDKSAIQAFSEQVTLQMQSSLHGYLEHTLAEELNGMTLDAYLKATRMTIDELLVVAGVNMGQLILDMIEPLRAVPCSGTYFVQEQQLHIAGTVCTYTQDGDSLSIFAPEDSSGLAAFPALFPLDFTRLP